MVTVKCIRSRPSEGYVEGQQYDVSESEAKRLIKRGFAVATVVAPSASAKKPASAAAKKKRL